MIRTPLTGCTDPVQRLALSSTGNPDRGMLVVVEERLESDDHLPTRPARFTLSGKARPLECCTPTSRAGFGVDFSDGGRGFYTYVYVDGASSRDVAAQVLDSLQIVPRTPGS